jgi:hypothetical protein
MDEMEPKSEDLHAMTPGERVLLDHPVSSAMGRRNTGSENIAPMATQAKRPPAATITQR